MDNKQPVDIVLNARWVIPIAPENKVLQNQSVAISKGRISGIAPTIEAKNLWHSQQEIDLGEHVLMPGLVNAHAHTPLNLFRGLADDLLLMDWLKNHMWPAELAILKPESITDGMNLAILEMLRSGTTCFCDHYFFHDTAAEVVTAAGIRANISLFIGNVPTVWAKNESEYFAKAQTTLNNTINNPLITWSLGPHSPYMVTEEGFKKIKKLSKQYNLPIHLHLHESLAEIDDSMRKFGQRPIQWLDNLGLLSSKLVAIHMVQMTPEDIDTIAQRGVSIVHCPESNLKLASGLAPVDRFLEAGINVALGTDGAASNNDLDMFGELRTAALLAKGVSLKATTLPASQALQMATLNGAKAFGLEKEIGSLEVGKAADIIAVDLSSVTTQPIYNPISQLVYALNSQQVSDVWVAGRQLLKNGQFTQLDPASILQKVQSWTLQAKAFMRV